MNILITGCNRGLGLCLVKALLSRPQQPTHIFATCRDISKAQELCELAEKNECLQILQIDLRNFCEYPHLAQKICDIVGDEGLNAIINNAAIKVRHSRIDNLCLNDFYDAFEVNAIAPIMLVHACLIILKRGALNMTNNLMGFERAAIVFIGSEMGSIELNKEGGDYAARAAKTALNVYCKSLVKDLCINRVLCVTICPGWIRTDMGGMDAPLKPQDSADQIVELLFKMNDTHNGGFFRYDGERLPN